MSIGVVIVTHNNKHTITPCVASIISQGVQDIVVIDSASSDDIEPVVQSHGIPFIQLSENEGFGHSANRGAQILNTDYVLFLNPDAIALPGAIGELSRVISKSPDAGIIGGLLQNSSGIPEPDACGQEPTVWRMILRKFTNNEVLGDVSKVDWVSGGALMIKKDLFEKLGGFDEQFFLYWEDVDLCKRARLAGYTVILALDAKFSHMRGESSSNQIEKTRLYDASATRYFQKYHSPFIWHLQYLVRKTYRLFRPLAR